MCQGQKKVAHEVHKNDLIKSITVFLEGTVTNLAI